MKIHTLGLVGLIFAAPLAARSEAVPMTIYKDPNCGCCTAWADLATAAGYAVTTVETDDIMAIKDKLGISPDLASCHTTEVGGYVVEGHVPLELVAEMLDTQPAIDGIAVPGMPAGSPGMGDDPNARYDVLGFGGEAGEGRVIRRMGTP